MPVSRACLWQAELIAEAGAIEPLVALLNGEKGIEAQEEAAGALTALARYQSNRIAISDIGGIGPLVALLGSPNAKAREHAEQALVRLSIEAATRVLIIEQLVSMLKDERGTDAQEQAALALASPAPTGSPLGAPASLGLRRRAAGSPQRPLP